MRHRTRLADLGLESVPRDQQTPEAVGPPIRPRSTSGGGSVITIVLTWTGIKGDYIICARLLFLANKTVTVNCLNACRAEQIIDFRNLGRALAFAQRHEESFSCP